MKKKATRRARKASASAGRRPSRRAPARRAIPAAAPASGPPTVVAVGASAGGLEALLRVLARLDAPDVALILVQHRPLDGETALPAILTGKTTLEVLTPASGTPIESRHLYVIPPHANAEVRDGQLHIQPPTEAAPFAQIDFLFTSLARWAQHRAIGVILSGTGSDGTAGVREIKAQGGLTIAQAPESAQYDGMPRAAIETGMIDLVLTPEEIADQIAQIRSHPYLAPSTAPRAEEGDLAVTEAQLREIYVLLRRASGIDFRQYKVPTIKRRLLRRMAVRRVINLDVYLRYIEGHPQEAAALAQDLLIHVTRFFRDPESFDGLQAAVFPALLQPDQDDDLRIWVPGCSTGEEAYSLAIALFESFGERATERRIQIFATDVSEASIERARAGTYPVSIAADVSPDRLKRFFVRTDGGYRVSKLIRDLCVLARHDLTRDPPFSRLNLIACRNVLIYLEPPLQRRLVMVFHYALKPGGFLMLGAAETPGAQVAFTPVDKRWRIFRKSLMAQPPPPAPEGIGGRLDHARPVHGGPAAPTERKSVLDEANRLLLERYAPPAVIVDANLHIVQFRGRTGPFLEAASGEPNLSVLKMARGGLLHPLQTALHSARRRRRPVRKDHVLVQHDGGWREIGIEVVPLTTRGEHMLVLFIDAPAAKAPGKAGHQAAGRRGREAEGRLGELRRELSASREYLQSIIQELEASNEELQSANEEILSSNEELQSTNEELDTAKEELQSMNEELNTLNEELHTRNEELTRVNSDLVNLLGAVDVPIVIVGDDLTIRRFTPKAEAVFNLISGDVGRRIGQINPNFRGVELESIIRETIEQVTPNEREVRDRQGAAHLLRVRPYRTGDNRLSGAVLTLLKADGASRSSATTDPPRGAEEASDGSRQEA